MTKPIYHITAYNTMKGTNVDLYFKSIEEAHHFNPGLVNFKIVG